MKKELAEAICNACNCEIYEDYSGRGMYGDTTTGIVVKSEISLITDILRNLRDISEQLDEANIKSIDIRNLCIDSLGHDVIIY